MMSLHSFPASAGSRALSRALCLTLGCLVFPAASMAQNAVRPGEVRVVVVNVERLIVDSAGARAAAAKIEQEFAPRRLRVQAQLRELREMSEKFTRDAPTLNDREYLVRERAVGELEREVRRVQAQISDDFAERSAAERAVLVKRIHDIVLALPAQLGADLVLTRTIWHRPAIDVTDKAAKLLEK